jgi:hypothetical protein
MADADVLAGLVKTGTVLQSIQTNTVAVATGTTTIPADDTIPQSTEGNALAALDTVITPKSATSKLRVDVQLHLAHPTVGAGLVALLFKDADAGALAVQQLPEVSANAITTVNLTHWMTSGTTSPITFKVRYGSGTAGTVTLNGSAAARFYGGVLASSVSVTEFSA